jgi:hypothetical protein
MDAIGTNRLLEGGQSMSALPGNFSAGASPLGPLSKWVRTRGPRYQPEDPPTHFIQGGSGKFFLRRKSGLKSLD